MYGCDAMFFHHGRVPHLVVKRIDGMLSYHYMQRALLAGTLIGIVCAVIGTYVVLKGLSFIGAGIAMPVSAA